jgi:hypothetical protein
MDRILNYCEIGKNDFAETAIRNQAAKQKSHHSEHKYTLEEFGLSKEQIMRDFDFIYSNYNV